MGPTAGHRRTRGTRVDRLNGCAPGRGPYRRGLDYRTAGQDRPHVTGQQDLEYPVRCEKAQNALLRRIGQTGAIVEKSAQAAGDHSTLGFVFREDESDAATADIPVLREPPRPPARDPRRRTLVTVLAAAVALLAIAIAGYLWYVAHSWQDKASTLRSVTVVGDSR